jgi:Predicted glycosyltransferases
MSESVTTPRITVSISTRNRLESLTRCVQSVTLISDFVDEIIIFDDASDAPLEEPLRQSLAANFPIKLRIIRGHENKGPSAARNEIARVAESDFVLNLDDDAFIIEARGILEALKIMRQDERVAVVALAQANHDGKSWPEFMQPAPVQYACQVPAFTGYAYLLRRETYLSIGGYREEFFYMGEEKECCLRLMDAGYKIIYLPDARVAHIADSSGRNHGRFIRLTVRNDCLSSLYNDPLLLMTVTVPFRLYSYFKMKRGLKVDDPAGFGWIVRQLFSYLPEVWRARRPVKWATIKRWRQLRREWPRYQASEAE